MIPLTKTLDPADLVELELELSTVDLVFDKDAPQHPMRRWEYAMAFRAYAEWWKRHSGVGGPIYDVGGSGSPFYRVLDPYQVMVVDPKELDGRDLAQYLKEGPKLGSAVFCLSVLEHIPPADFDRFCFLLSCLVAPGGLLFLTMDFGDMIDAHPLSNKDPFHFHWMREQIMTAHSHRALLRFFTRLYFEPFGGVDAPIDELIRYHGPHVYDYTFASLALIKRS